jgi:hypothetical protein
LLRGEVLDQLALERKAIEAGADVDAQPFLGLACDWRCCSRWPTTRHSPTALTRRTVSPSSYAPAERLVEALARGGLDDVDVLAAFRAVLGLVMGSVQVELAGPLAGPDRDIEQASVAARIGRLAGAEHPRLGALAQTSQESTAVADFNRALDMLLAGVQSRSRSG